MESDGIMQAAEQIFKTAIDVEVANVQPFHIQKTSATGIFVSSKRVGKRIPVEIRVLIHDEGESRIPEVVRWGRLDGVSGSSCPNTVRILDTDDWCPILRWSAWSRLGKLYPGYFVFHADGEVRSFQLRYGRGS